MRPTGIILIILSLAVPFMWFPSIAAGKDSVALFSQYMGIWSLITMAIVQIIATRAFFVEWIFGGLDRSYILHKWLGILAMVFLLIHDTVDAEMVSLGQQSLLEEFAETLGEISLYGLIMLVVITVATFVPYHLWRWTHRVMGAFFVAGALHYLLILKPFENGDPLGLYTTAFCVAGILAFAYRLLPPGFRPTKRYEVASIAQTGNALSVTLAPKGRPMRHSAGQFAFVSFEGAEPHPFTLSNAPTEDGVMRISMAQLGDYTSRLPSVLKTGTAARVEGPFGHFERQRGKRPEIWVAAGIGITPFLAWAEAMQDDEREVHMFYCVRDEDSAAHLSEIQTLAQANKNMTLHMHYSSTDGRVTAQHMLLASGLSARDAVISFCGPKPMRETLARDFRKAGVSRRRFRYEEFEIRTGIGMRKLSGWLFRRATRAHSAFSA